MNPLRWAGLGLRKVGKELLRLSGKPAVWVDVGAHVGQASYREARDNPRLIVYAFEPNWTIARTTMGKLANFVVLPIAVSDVDGMSEFHVNEMDQASSLLPFDPDGLNNWKGKEALAVTAKIKVPTIRLDTFMNAMAIRTVDFLKIDAQGSDFAVICSAGVRLRDIRKITLEVDVTAARLYRGSRSRQEIVDYLSEKGFRLAGTEMQTYGQEENLTFLQGEPLAWNARES